MSPSDSSGAAPNAALALEQALPDAGRTGAWASPGPRSIAVCVGRISD